MSDFRDIPLMQYTLGMMAVTARDVLEVGDSVERQRDIAVEALRKIVGTNAGPGMQWFQNIASRACSDIAALDPPDLAEIGWKAWWAVTPLRDPSNAALLAAYTTMRAADEEACRRDVEDDPRVRELIDAASALVIYRHPKEESSLLIRVDRLRAALAAFGEEQND